MNSETVTLIRELADRLGVTADRLVDLFIPRVVADAAFWMIVGIVGLAVVWGSMYRASKHDWFEDGEVLFHGKQQYLARLHGEWQRAEPAHREAICGVARQEASTLDPKHLPPSLALWECVK